MLRDGGAGGRCVHFVAIERGTGTASSEANIARNNRGANTARSDAGIARTKSVIGGENRKFSRRY